MKENTFLINLSNQKNINELIQDDQDQFLRASESFMPYVVKRSLI